MGRRRTEAGVEEYVDIAERLPEFADAVFEITTRLPANSPGRQPRTGEQGTGNEERRMKGDDTAERLLEFAVAVLEITTRLPANSPGRQPPR